MATDVKQLVPMRNLMDLPETQTENNSIEFILKKFKNPLILVFHLNQIGDYYLILLNCTCRDIQA